MDDGGADGCDSDGYDAAVTEKLTAVGAGVDAADGVSRALVVRGQVSTRVWGWSIRV